MEDSKPMYHLVRLGISDDTHPSTWKNIDQAMKEIEFTPQEPKKSNSAVSYLGPFDGNPNSLLDQVSEQLQKRMLPMVSVEMELFDLPEGRQTPNGLGSVRACH